MKALLASSFLALLPGVGSVGSRGQMLHQNTPYVCPCGRFGFLHVVVGEFNKKAGWCGSLG